MLDHQSPTSSFVSAFKRNKYSIFAKPFLQIPIFTFSFIDSVHIFPNFLTSYELFFTNYLFKDIH